MREVYVTGAGVVPFGYHFDETVKAMTADAVDTTLADAGVNREDIDAVFFGNCLGGLIIGQEVTRGPVACIPAGFGHIPIHTVEGSCATGGTALHLAYMAVASGLHDTVLAIGTEKANIQNDRKRTYAAYQSGLDQDENLEAEFEASSGAGENRALVVDRHALIARRMMAGSGLELEDFARLAAVAMTNASHNPAAHRRMGGDWKDILKAKPAAEPLTALMMCPISDGAAGVVVSSRPGPGRAIRIAASVAATRPPLADPGGASATETAAALAYKMAGIGPDTLDIAELHDASVPYLLLSLRETGICPTGQEREWIRTRRTSTEGAMPVNTSGGSLMRGHALAATGLAQVAEIVQQFRGAAGKRQVNRELSTGMALCAGGVIKFQTALAVAHILQATN